MEINRFTENSENRFSTEKYTRSENESAEKLQEIGELFDKIIVNEILSKPLKNSTKNSLKKYGVIDLKNEIKGIEIDLKNKIKNIKKEICNVEELKNLYEQKIIVTVPYIGFLVELTFEKFNLIKLNKENHKLDKLNKEKIEYESLLELINIKSIITEDVGDLAVCTNPEKIAEIEKHVRETLKDTKFKEIDREVKGLIQQAKESFFSNVVAQMSKDSKNGNLEKVFESEYRLRALVDLQFLDKEVYQNLFEKRVNQSLQQAKEAIVKNPVHFSAQAAANVGDAAHVGFIAMKKLAETTPFIKNSAVSNQEVFLLPNEETVFKKSKEKPKEDEKKINELADISFPGAFVGSFDIKKPTLERYGIEISHDALERGFKGNSISPKLLFEIKKKLSSESSRVVNQYSWDGKISELCFTPDLSKKEDKIAYEACEKFKWTYTAKNGANEIVDFKTLHARELQNEFMINIKPILNNGETGPNDSILKKAFNVPWKTLSPEIMQDKATKLNPLSNIQAKRFIGDMILMDKLSLNMKETVLNRLTDRDQAIAILTSELQLLDLHSENLGVAPIPNEAYESFKDTSFQVLGRGPLNIKELLLRYLNGNINSYTNISFIENGVNISKKLKDLPRLLEAFKVDWKLVVFDTDLSLAEDNRLQFQTRANVVGHLIPLRSVLLETSWKDKLLSKKAIELINSEERDARIIDWVNNKHSSIYKRLSPEIAEKIQIQVAPILSKYDLSEPRKKDDKMTIEKLKRQFSIQFSNANEAENLKIWQTMEQDLSLVTITIRKDDTWETLAKRYHQEVDVLKSLNPEGLPAKGKIKIKYDLTSNTDQAEKRRRKIAADLFPPITIRQKEALLERLQNRKKYLANFQALSESTSKDMELSNQIEKFINDPSTPLCSTRKEEIIKILKNANAEDFKPSLEQLKNDLCLECQPTYFNLIKAMYPLLADVYALNKAISNSDKEAGKQIGLYTKPLEDTINSAKKKFLSGSPEYRLALLLEEKIKSISNPSFFGHWD